MPAARFMGMGSGNESTTASKVKKNLFSKECNTSETNCEGKNLKRPYSKILTRDNGALIPIEKIKRSRSPVNIVVINGAWMKERSSSHVTNSSLNNMGINAMDNEENSWIYHENSGGDGNEVLGRPRIYSQEMSSVGNEVGYSDDSLSSLCDLSPVPVRSMETRPEDDRDTENLGWLLNFNVHSLVNPGGSKPNLSDALNSEATTSMQDPTMRVNNCSSSSFQGDPVGLCSSDSKSNTRKFQQGQGTPRPNVKVSTLGAMKPPFTYSELIEKALAETGELTVSELYHWISFHFPFYQPNDDRWKNSVRHNLSINPHFRKGRKSTQGAGHLWSLAPTYKKKEGTDSDSKGRKQGVQYNQDIHMVTLQEVEAATASIEEDKENRQLPSNDVYYFDTTGYDEIDAKGDEFSITILGASPDRGLVQSAEEILNGVKKDVEVQYVLPVQECNLRQIVNRNGSEFLNPVSMQEVVAECGLSYQLGDTGIGSDGTSFMITEINPETLGINIVESITPDLFGDHMDLG